MPFTSCGGCLRDIFITEAEIIDRYVGNQLWALGFGPLGDNTNIAKSSPVQTVSGGTNWRQVSIRAGIKTDGSLWLWGVNNNGRLADNTNVNRSSPVQTVSGGTNWRQVSMVKSNPGGAALKTDGTLWLWGTGEAGRIGNNSTATVSSPVQTVSGGTNWKVVSSGHNTTAAIKTDGTLWIWGQSSGGLLGTNDAVTRSSPVQTVSGGTDWKTVCLARNSSAAIKTDGTLWLWGQASNGRLGNNDLANNQSSPVQTVSGGTNWKQISLSDFMSAAIKTDGTLWVWGRNTNGELGTNNLVSYSSPVQTISGGTNWKQIAAGFSHNAAIKTDGTLWTWGSALNGGAIGTNNLVGYSSPVQTVSGGTNWKSVETGECNTTAITFTEA